jgi:hypothetical protein
MKVWHRCHIISLNFIEALWLHDHRQLFVHTWTYQHLHLGTVITLRVESAHSLLKRYACISTVNISHNKV